MLCLDRRHGKHGPMRAPPPPRSPVSMPSSLCPTAQACRRGGRGDQRSRRAPTGERAAVRFRVELPSFRRPEIDQGTAGGRLAAASVRLGGLIGCRCRGGWVVVLRLADHATPARCWGVGYCIMRMLAAVGAGSDRCVDTRVASHTDHDGSVHPHNPQTRPRTLSESEAEERARDGERLIHRVSKCFGCC